MSPEPLDLPRIIDALNSVPGVRSVLVGGMAVMLYGGTRVTFDADFAVAFDLENRRLVAEALAPLHPRPPRMVPGATFAWDEKCITPPWTIYQTDAGRVDLIVRLPGVDSFDGLYARSEIFDLGGVELRVASIDDLIAMKTAADRDRDRDDRNQLLAIRKLRQTNHSG